jgi:hypothetical protein
MTNPNESPGCGGACGRAHGLPQGTCNKAVENSAASRSHFARAHKPAPPDAPDTTQ